MTDIQWRDDAPIYRQLKELVITQMLEGQLQPGQALPSVRQVAADYQLNPITVSRAYQELVDEQLVEKRRGLGAQQRAGSQQQGEGGSDQSAHLALRPGKWEAQHRA